MKGLLLRQGTAVVVEHPDPTPPAGEALVRVTCAGICGTDLEIAQGYLGFDGIPGHEFVGVVESAPDPRWVGRRVVGEINASCGSCGECAAGRRRHCAHRTVLGIAGRDGVFAERATLPVENLHPVPPGVSDDVAVFTEPMAAAYEIVEQGLVAPDARVLVMGDGRLGQLCAHVLRRFASEVAVVGHHCEKLALLARRGVRVFEGDVSNGDRFDVVVEATGSAEALPAAFRHVRPCGTIVLKTTAHGAGRIDLAPVVIDEIRVVGSRCGPFSPALRHLESEPDVARELITARYALDDADRAFRHASDSSALKILIHP